MNPLVGVLILASLVGFAGYQQVLGAVRQALGVGWQGGVVALEAAALGAVAAWPYLVRALCWWLGTACASILLVATGLTIGEPFPIFIAGLLMWFSFMLIFGSMHLIATVVAGATRVGVKAMSWALAVLAGMLSWFGLVKPEAAKEIMGAVQLELLPAGLFRHSLGEIRRRTYVIWWLMIVSLLIVPSWTWVWKPLAILAAMTIFGWMIAVYKGWSIDLFWRLLYWGLVPAACLLAIFNFAFPEQAMWAQCKLRPDVEVCREYLARRKIEEIHAVMLRQEKEMRKWVIRKKPKVQSSLPSSQASVDDDGIDGDPATPSSTP